MPLFALVLTLSGCDGSDSYTPSGNDQGNVQDTSLDLDGPVISHDVVPSPQYMLEDVMLSARVVDADSQVLAVQLFYRQQTSESFKQGGMVLIEPEEGPGGVVIGGTYQGKIPVENLGSSGMHYYFQAVDIEQNMSVYPQAAPEEFFKFDLTDVE